MLDTKDPHNSLKFINAFLNHFYSFFLIDFHKNQNDQTLPFIALSFFHVFFIFSLISFFLLRPYLPNRFLHHLTINLIHFDLIVHLLKIVNPLANPKLSQAIDSHFLDLIHIFFIIRYSVEQEMKKECHPHFFSCYLIYLKN